MNISKFEVEKIKNITDDLGFSKKETIQSFEIWGKYISIGRTDFFASKQSNIELSDMIKVRCLDYNDISENRDFDEIYISDVEKNRKYKVIREFQKEDDEYIILYLSDISIESV